MRKHVLNFTIIAAVAIPFALAGEDRQKVRDPQEAAKAKAAIERYIQKDQELKGDFLLRDPKSGAVRNLNLDYVHDGVEKAPGNQYIACVDFVDENTKDRLDVDFFLEPQQSGELQVSKLKVHKVNGAKVEAAKQ